MANLGTLTRQAVATCAAVLSLAVSAPLQAQDDAPGIARACLSHPTIKRTKVLDDRNIIFITRDDAIYNNALPRQCPGLRRGGLLNYPIENKRLCAGGVFQVLWEMGNKNYVPAFVCQLGNFVPITEDELADLTAMTAVGKDRNERRRSNREAVTAEPVAVPRPEPVESLPTEPVEPPPAEPAIEP
jgi:hypothetical protein